jgi:hypothetical protein
MFQKMKNFIFLLFAMIELLSANPTHETKKRSVETVVEEGELTNTVRYKYGFFSDDLTKFESNKLKTLNYQLFIQFYELKMKRMW